MLELLPAIDLKGGKAVRLTRGIMESAKIYNDDPSELAKYFEDIGARWLHIVDLDGAFAGNPRNLEKIKKIRQSCALKIELGGGIRSEETIRRYVEMGIDRVILGSVAMRDPDFVQDMASRYKIAVGIDAKDGYVLAEGWAQRGAILATRLAERFREVPLDAIICTDVSKDGTLEGINREFTQAIARASGHFTIASGGLAHEDEIALLAQTEEIAGVIVGKAFYEGRIDLATLYKKGV